MANDRLPLSPRLLVLGLICLGLLAACGNPSSQNAPAANPEAVTDDSFPEPSQQANATEANQAQPSDAAIEGVSVSGSPGTYQFSVTIRSSETGCDRYADWWEVVDESGQLLYRRILAHSHVDEQPFTRSGGPVPLQPEETAIVRVHMNTSGYSPQAYQGQVTAEGSADFQAATLPSGFAAELAQQDPLPTGCAF